MRLAHKDFHFIMPLAEASVTVLVLERSDSFRKYVAELSRQCDGKEGGFVISKNWEPVSLSGSALILTDLFDIEINSKKQLTVLYKKMNQIAISPSFVRETEAIKNALSTWLMYIENELPVPVIHDLDISIADILKSCGIHFDYNEASIPDVLEMIVKVCAGFLCIPILICIGLHDILDEKELISLYKEAEYEKLSILDIERHCPEYRHPKEKTFILDKDLCEIYNESDENSSD